MRIESRFERAYYLTTCFVLSKYATHALAHLTPQAQAIVVYAEKTTIVDK